MTANSYQPTLQKVSSQGGENGDGSRSSALLYPMWEIVRNRPYAVLESRAGDAKIDNMQVAIWRNHLLEYHFLRAFRNTLAQTPRQYVLHRRVTKAQDLIRQGKLSLADIAYQLGFSSQSHFSTAFKQITGITPTQFQRL
jgi:hypothetical protein